MFLPYVSSMLTNESRVQVFLHWKLMSDRLPIAVPILMGRIDALPGKTEWRDK
jgi:hypothetical protein